MISEMTVGARETLRMLEKGHLKEVLVARDSDRFVVRPVIETAEQRRVKVTYIDTKKSLGSICGIGNGAAVAGMIREKKRIQN